MKKVETANSSFVIGENVSGATTIPEGTHEYSDIAFPSKCQSYRLSKFEYQHIHTHHIEKLKARLLNLADSMTTDERQAKSMKGLIKDFCNMAHLDGRNDLDNWAVEREIISKHDITPVSCI